MFNSSDDDLDFDPEADPPEEPLPELPVPTGLELTQSNEYFRNCPYDLLEELRTREPVHRDIVLNRIILTRHDDVRDVLCNNDLSRDRHKGNADGSVHRTGFDPAEKLSPLYMDGPDHTRLRSLVSQGYAEQTIESFRPRIRTIITGIVDYLDEHEFEFDIVDMYAARIPPLVSGALLGIDAALQDQFTTWSNLITGTVFNPTPSEAQSNAAATARTELDALFSSLIAARRNSPGDDLISALLRAQDAGTRLADDEIVQQCQLLLLGNAVTIALIGNGIKALLCNPQQMARLRSEPELIGNTVEEILRFEPPVISCVRSADADIVIGGCPVAQGETLSASLAAANRDPAIYPDPDTFDIGRTDTHHQAFGGGHHTCLGAQLARMQAQEAIVCLIVRFNALEIAPKTWGFGTTENLRSLTDFWVRN